MEKKMIKKLLPVLLALTVVLSACAPKAEPTMAPADVEGTAVSAAFTMVYLTQISIPTATPLPPTETPSPTPLPTFTLQPLIPTLAPLILPTATSAPSDPNNCLKPLNVAEAGSTNPMRIENASGGVIEWLSLNLSTNAFGQCGAMSYNNIPINGKKVIALPRGDWWAWAGIKYKDGTSGNASGSFTIRQGDEDMLRILVGKETIRALP
jgi:hypothetical protein